MRRSQNSRCWNLLERGRSFNCGPLHEQSLRHKVCHHTSYRRKGSHDYVVPSIQVHRTLLRDPIGVLHAPLLCWKRHYGFLVPLHRPGGAGAPVDCAGVDRLVPSTDEGCAHLDPLLLPSPHLSHRLVRDTTCIPTFLLPRCDKVAVLRGS